MSAKCPGAQSFNQPRPEDVKCPHCKGELEIWSDEFKTTCPNCKKMVIRDMELSCVEWCRYAKDCIGDQAYSRYMKKRAITLKQKLLKELEDYFDSDVKRINHAKNVMHFAEELLKSESGDWHIVVSASILHDIGIKKAEEEHNSSAGNLQEKEGPAIARKILLRSGLQMKDINEICDIIAHHHTPGIINTNNFRILYDSDWLVNLKDEVKQDDREGLKHTIEKVFLTSAGKEIAQRTYLNKEDN